MCGAILSIVPKSSNGFLTFSPTIAANKSSIMVSTSVLYTGDGVKADGAAWMISQSSCLLGSGGSATFCIENAGDPYW